MPLWNLVGLPARGFSTLHVICVRRLWAPRKTYFQCQISGVCLWRAPYTGVATGNSLRKQLKEEAKAKRAAARDGPTEFLHGIEPSFEGWKLTVGIEIHAQLNTARKLFSAASVSVNDVPNSHVALFDVAIPGSMPVFEKATLLPAIRAALALGCQIQPRSSFDRKHYFYHDQPAGYQLTQFYEAFAKHGSVRLTRDDGIGATEGAYKDIGIAQVQMEQDTAKSQGSDGDSILIDYNRAGQALIEIISLPEIHSPETAVAYVRKVQSILLFVNAVATGMEMGGLRADVNVSVQRNLETSADKLGQRTEIKNLNTLKGVEAAIRAERNRQINVLEAGEKVESETRAWSSATPSITRRLRGKEDSVDYRYLPDPDLAPIIIGEDLIGHLRRTLPILPDQAVAMLTNDKQYGMSLTDAKILLSLNEGSRFEYYLRVVDETIVGSRGKHFDTASESIGPLAANWVLHELGSLLTASGVSWQEDLVPANKLAAILINLLDKKITGRSAKKILKLIFEGDKRDVNDILHEDGLEFHPLPNEEYLDLARSIMRDHADVVFQIKDKGKTGKLMFLVGQMLKAGEVGRVEAKTAEEVLRRLITS